MFYYFYEIFKIKKKEKNQSEVILECLTEQFGQSLTGCELKQNQT